MIMFGKGRILPNYLFSIKENKRKVNVKTSNSGSENNLNAHFLYIKLKDNRLNYISIEQLKK